MFKFYDERLDDMIYEVMHALDKWWNNTIVLCFQNSLFSYAGSSLAGLECPMVSDIRRTIGWIAYWLRTGASYGTDASGLGQREFRTHKQLHSYEVSAAAGNQHA
jgi:hypothetical protein